MLRRAIEGTRLEPWARKLWRLAKRQQPVDERGSLYDRQTIEIMQRVIRRHSDCIDIGAFKGELLAQMVSLAPEGKHLAFEPLPHLATQLRESFPTVEVFEMALADASGVLPFRHVIGLEAYSGFFRRPYDTYEERVEMISVDVRKLDDAVPSDFCPRFIKVDVEGSESKVFRGGLETIRRSSPFIVFESGWEPEDSFEVLVDGADLKLSLLESWLDGKASLSRDEFLDEALSGKHYYFLAHPDKLNHRDS